MKPKNQPSLKEIEQAIVAVDAEIQIRLLRDLPHLLKISPVDLALLKASEPSFDFWNNPDDIVYDPL